MNKKKVVLVTGAAQGIGKCIAETFATQGSKVILNDINVQALDSTVNDMRNRDLDVASFVADVSKDADVSEMINAVVRDFSRIDILVNNAAITIRNSDMTKKPTIDILADEWDLVMGVNLRSVFLCSKYVAKHMLTQGYGKIVNMSSILGKTGCAGDKQDNYHPISSTSASHYCASKAGIINFTRSFAREMAKFNIQVNAVAPGAVGVSGRFGGDVVERMCTQIPLASLASEQDIADSVFFLCSDKASYITGEVLNINGGWLMD